MPENQDDVYFVGKPPEGAPTVAEPFYVQGFPIERHWYVVHLGGKRLSEVAQAFRGYLLRHSAVDHE
ncbi:MAG: hypothetical protein LJE70_01095 [Chromatiaceae bacterium]|jgi:hypothetical protein|nr:hypothetical protein [Chromatiaceae bacterium]